MTPMTQVASSPYMFARISKIARPPALIVLLQAMIRSRPYMKNKRRPDWIAVFERFLCPPLSRTIYYTGFLCAHGIKE